MKKVIKNFCIILLIGHGKVSIVTIFLDYGGNFSIYPRYQL
jgi:hypothetical protein